MTRDTRRHLQRPRPTEAARRAMQEIASLLATPPANLSADELLAMRRQCWAEAEAVDGRQGCLPLAAP